LFEYGKRAKGEAMPAAEVPPERAASPDAATLRVFFALVPSAELRNALADLGRERARRLHGRPVPADNVHLTLAFVGAWPRARLDALLAAGAAVDGEAMGVTLDRQGGFRRSGVAWVAPSSAPATLGLVRRQVEQHQAPGGGAHHVVHLVVRVGRRVVPGDVDGARGVSLQQGFERADTCIRLVEHERPRLSTWLADARPRTSR
jgi:hypothetical protein